MHCIFRQEVIHMQRITRVQPFRALRALFHGRFQRRQNFRFNTMTLLEREEMVRQERELRTNNPEAFADGSLYGGPFSAR